MVKKLYIDGELSRIGDFNIEIKDEPEKYTLVKRDSVGFDWDFISNDECVWYCNHKHYELDKENIGISARSLLRRTHCSQTGRRKSEPP